ncbi:MAG: 5'-deoxynucleotidase [Eubacteriales bacterium SKADARSKE-1]|nr:5'-deoxynucleotidase [Eubacteriales bacterium SKADARSKE-1]
MNTNKEVKLTQINKISNFFIKILSCVFACVFSSTLCTTSLCLADENVTCIDPSKGTYLNENLLQNYIDSNNSKSGSCFLSFLFRMKYVNRWNVLKKIKNENLEEHSFEVAIIAHALATIKNQYFNGNINTERVAILALFHDAPEIITDDMPTPIKYHSLDMKKIYDKIESDAINELLGLLPDKMRNSYIPLLKPSDEDKELWNIVKAADTLCALIKCLEEKNSGNTDFAIAEKSIIKSIQALKSDEVNFFIKEFMPSFGLNFKV